MLPKSEIVIEGNWFALDVGATFAGVFTRYQIICNALVTVS
jgi:hypothetical protein